jgi:hypothetical protein
MYLNYVVDIYLFNLFQSKFVTKTGLWTLDDGKTEVEYKYTDKYFLIDFTEKHLPLIQHICTHKALKKGDSSKLIILKNLHTAKKTTQLLLKYSIDLKTTQFVIMSPTLSNLNENILSRCSYINCRFDKVKLIKYTGLKSSVLQDCQNNLIIAASGDSISNMRLMIRLDQLIDKMKSSTNQHMIIGMIREFVYHIYHLSVPIADIMHYIIHKMMSTKYASRIVEKFAQIDVSVQNNIYSYEQMFIDLALILKK